MTAESFLDAVDARAAAATPGPWIVNPVHFAEDDPDGSPHDEQVISAMHGYVCDLVWHVGDTQIADAAFIAAARTDLPRLAAALRAVLALCDLADADGSPGWIPMMPPNGVRATIVEHLGSPA